MKVRIDWAMGALVCTAGACVTASVWAGGIEHFCNSGGAGAMLTEVWGSSGVNISWTVCTGPSAASAAAPGYPQMSCVTALADSAKPVFQSIFNAMSTWNDASIPPAGPKVSTFSFALPSNFTTVPAQPNATLPPTEVFTPIAWWSSPTGPNHISEITLWDGPSSFVTFGGPNALAVSSVLPLPSGLIDECDIALQARTLDPSGRPYWCFVEENVALGRTLTTVPDLAPGFGDPALGYVDLQGVLTHELGHFLGLGHSLVDATQVISTSTFPTMFAEAQNEPYSATVSIPAANCSFVTQPTNTAATAVQGRLGASARTLEFDDLFAIAEGYPQPEQITEPYWAQTGQIEGTVTGGLSGANTLWGVSVIAVNAAQPDAIRVGTLTYKQSGMTYRITGLPPGSYYLKIETVDVDYGPPTGKYFIQPDVPNFVQSPGMLGCVGSAPPLVATEWYDAAEGDHEPSNALATPIVVAAGTTTTAHLVVNLTPDDVAVAPDQLRVSATNNPFQSSPRGARVGANSIPAVTAGFFLSGMQQGSAVHLFIDIKRTMIPMGFQLLEVYPLFHFTAVADGQGTAQFSFPITPSLARVNFFAQAAWVEPEPSGVVHLTNSVNLWVRGP